MEPEKAKLLKQSKVSRNAAKVPLHVGDSSDENETGAVKVALLLLRLAILVSSANLYLFSLISTALTTVIRPNRLSNGRNACSKAEDPPNQRIRLRQMMMATTMTRMTKTYPSQISKI